MTRVVFKEYAQRAGKIAQGFALAVHAWGLSLDLQNPRKSQELCTETVDSGSSWWASLDIGNEFQIHRETNLTN